jgi:hypothetical protein
MRKFCLADKTVNSFVIAVYMPMMCWRNGVLVNWKNDDLFSDAINQNVMRQALSLLRKLPEFLFFSQHWLGAV